MCKITFNRLNEILRTVMTNFSDEEGKKEGREKGRERRRDGGWIFMDLVKSQTTW